ncbi:hypothetical protein GF326_08730, partial [Candidatus Bathyarchaeota archaeon]|nr:hypothetical protein [Candidatus Bathyarchaeota archaeon]
MYKPHTSNRHRLINHQRIALLMNEDIERIRAIANYQFGKKAGKVLFPDYTRIEYSKNTNRPRHIYLGDIMIANFRATDALFTLTIAGAKRLNNLEGLTGYVVVI